MILIQFSTHFSFRFNFDIAVLRNVAIQGKSLSCFALDEIGPVKKLLKTIF